MPREFNIPATYRSERIASLKQVRRELDSRKRDFSPVVFRFSKFEIALARFFGFCFGVENAIERAYQAVNENPGRRVFLLSEMIHNPFVNQNLRNHGVEFLQSTSGESYIPLSSLSKEDVVIVPAFGTTRALFQELRERGIQFERYDTTCPFVEKVWKRSAQLGTTGFSIVIHGKHEHEETRATFSHAATESPSIVVRDKAEAEVLISYIRGESSESEIMRRFEGRMTEGFTPSVHLFKVGVVNQTTMLASETHEISLMFRDVFLERFGKEKLHEHFADTRDTLCYATNENQSAAQALSNFGGELALVVGGYNSSNTSHLVELLESKCPTYFIKDATEITSLNEINHLNIQSWSETSTTGWYPNSISRPRILLTAGASCPDVIVEGVIVRLLTLSGIEEELDEVFLQTLQELKAENPERTSRLTVL